MQCVNCGFENLPGTAVCGRCQSGMAFGEMAIEPPRASRLRLGTRLRRVSNRVTERLHIGAVAWRFHRPAMLDGIDWSGLAWSVVPGIAHIRRGQRILGSCLLGGWSLFLLGALVTMASGESSWLVSSAVTVHAAVVISVLAPNLSVERLPIRLAFGALVFVGLRFWVYAWGGSAIGLVVVPMEVPHIPDVGVIATGDGLLCEGPWLRSREYHRGDLVVYDIMAGGGRGYVVQSGTGLDRIVGVPGDHVELRRGQLFVNGVRPLPRCMPLASYGLNTFVWDVPPATYVILPSLIQATVRGQAVSQDGLAHLCTVSELSIIGRVRWRTSPWRRIGRID